MNLHRQDRFEWPFCNSPVLTLCGSYHKVNLPGYSVLLQSLGQFEWLFCSSSMPTTFGSYHQVQFRCCCVLMQNWDLFGWLLCIFRYGLLKLFIFIHQVPHVVVLRSTKMLKFLILLLSHCLYTLFLLKELRIYFEHNSSHFFSFFL